MSYQKTPSRTRYSVPNFPAMGTPSTPGQLSRSSSSVSESRQLLRPPDLRRPPSSRGFRSSSPMLSLGGPHSRPGSAMGNYAGSSSGSGSRPTTPSLQRVDPYTGTITVSIRPNPYTVHPHQPSPWLLDLHSNAISNAQDHSSFQFDNVFLSAPELSQNSKVYEKSCAGLVQSFLNDAYNATVFAYGMTGSGKTFSMRGSEQDPGFVKLAIDDIFHHVSTTHSMQYKLTVSYLEIYNERIIDLLSNSPSTTMDLKIRDDSVYGNKIVGLHSIDITSKEQLMDLINKGDNKRKTSATDFNARSSRSHSILQLKLNTINLVSSTETNSTLSLCDLAGSERATSHVERRKEGSFINKSLLALSTVINKLSIASNGLASSLDHIPYRDSKLTRLLQPALSGSSLISVLCTIHLGGDSSSQQFISETYNTLRFAARARNIVMNVAKNKANHMGETNAEALKVIEDLKRTIERQGNELELLKSNSFNSNSKNFSDGDFRAAELEGENAVLNDKIEHLNRLTDLQNTETVIVKNETLNDILGSGLEGNMPQVLMANLEEFYRRVNHEVTEYKSYISVLEGKLKLQSQKLALNHDDPSAMNVESTGTPLTNNVSFEMEAVLKDQEEEILYLKELIKDKDHIIKGLTKTSKLRRLMESNSVNVHEETEKHLPMSLDSDGKENNFGDLKSFKVGRSPER